MENQTSMKEFNLVPFSAQTDYTSLIISVFSFLYICAVLTNSIIITVIYIDDQLHAPMFFFLCNLALVDMSFITTTVPKLLYMLFSGDFTISFIQCFTQMYFFVLSALTEDVLIFIMAYDRYVAICDPLHYHYILNRKNCILFASGAWILGCVNSFVFIFTVSNVSLCQANTIHQFFCDAKALINISCAGLVQFYIVIYLDSLVFVFLPAVFSVTSYIKIIKVILKIKSKDGRKKAFSTCSSHLILLLMYYMTGVPVYMMPPSEYSNILEQVCSAVFSVVTPMINPLIYSLRNKEVKIALMKLLGVKLDIWK